MLLVTVYNPFYSFIPISCNSPNNPPSQDKTSPSILSLSPENGAKNVSARANAVVVFSEAMKADTITTNSVNITTLGGTIDKQLLLSSDGKTLTIIYKSLTQRPDNITISLQPTITDLAGNALQTQAWSFEVPSWQTLTSRLDITPENFAFEPSIGAGPSNNPDEQNLFVAWYEQDLVGSKNRVYVKYWNGNTWQQLGGSLNTNLSNSTSDPSLVVDEQNRPVVAFQENDSISGDNSIYVKRWSGSTWVMVGSAVAKGSAEHPSLAISQNILGIAFTNTNGTNKAIFFKIFDGLSWQAMGAELNDVSLQNADFPSLDMIIKDGLAVPFVAFQESDGFSNNIYVKT